MCALPARWKLMRLKLRRYSRDARPRFKRAALVDNLQVFAVLDVRFFPILLFFYLNSFYSLFQEAFEFDVCLVRG